ncbi:hypothetical protein TIFTF001_037246 [Ficus carica]|uniref:Leucine-rich repeat-containing N-terminal plant-type domain-containing protein n=1 Tax=Ficus carica TaxID=3494 RepID=A0AA88E5Y3_FICCA|nr:hypothetical protein TIFTF001_037246 [Ficus carica]
MLLAILISLTGALGSTASGEGEPRATTRCKEAERHALLEIKENLHVRDVGFLSSWGNGDERRECCEWIGIRCDNKSGHVIRLDLSPSTLGRDQDLFLEGNLSSSLVDLQYLQYLDLSYINFSGNSIPSFIGSLGKLRYLNLSYSTMSGKVPPQLGNLSSLQFLDLSGNDYPEIENMGWASHLSSLQLLDLSYTNMSLAHDWVHVVNNLPHLKILKLGYSYLPDTVPLSLSFVNSSKVLAIIDLSYNFDLSSSIFQWLFKYSHNLVHLDLTLCDLNGSIPEAFENMAVLEYLDLSCNGLDGSIPQSFGNMTALEYLDLSQNGLDGSIPQSFGNMTALEFLDLSWNELEGSIPQSFGNLTALEYLDLSSNKFEGEILKSIWRVCTLRELRASNNSLAGELHLAESSTRCANFPLEELDLGNNQIMGSLPNFTLYPYLITLRLGSNKLDGVVSKSILQLSKLEVLDISENFIADVISEAHFYKLINLRFLDLSSNSKIVFEISPDWIPPFQLEEISLGYVNLGRHFPKWLQTQKSYSVLDISNSGISGSIPNWFWTNLPTGCSLNLSNNGISTLAHDSEGKDDLHAVRVEIDLSSNQLEGSIPLFLLQVATSLFLFDNNFSGLNSICNATQSLPLEFLDVSNNQLSGELPDCWSYAEDLKVLNLKENSLTGKIPISIGFLTQMVILRLSNNHLIGKLPSSLKNYTSLKVLDIGENSLSGQIPAWIGKSSNLVVLSLRSNNFYGSIPLQLCHLQTLQLLDLSSNRLSSSIPTCLGNISAMKQIGRNPQFVKPTSVYNRKAPYPPIPPLENDKLRLVWKGVVSEFKNAGLLRNIDLSSNKLIGVIPNKVTELVALVSLNLSRNNLSGEIPQNIGELKSLDVLDLSKNHLSGRIPSSLSQVSGLSTLDLSNNSLSGKIPTGTQLQTRDAAAYFGNPELCGDPLSKKCPSEDQPTTFRAIEDHGDDQDDEDQLITKGFYISSTFGFIVAFWGFCLALIFNKSWRYIYLKSLNKAEDWVYITIAVNKAKLPRIIKS